MGIIEGTRTPKSVTAEYDFSKDGGTVGTKTLRGVSGWDNSLPAGSYVTGGIIDVTTSLAGGASSTVALQVEGTGDILAADGTNFLTKLNAGRHDVVPDSTGDTSVKTTVTRNIKMVVAGAALTAGKFRVTLFYV
jgi:hypothetical protein